MCPAVLRCAFLCWRLYWCGRADGQVVLCCAVCSKFGHPNSKLPIQLEQNTTGMALPNVFGSEFGCVRPSQIIISLLLFKITPKILIQDVFCSQHLQVQGVQHVLSNPE